MILEAQSPTTIRFWEALMPAQNSETPCLQLWQGAAYQPTSFKDVHAQAQCVAGYLMRRGYGKGDHIGILARPGLRYHVLHIAMQYLGVVNVTFPPSFTTEEIEQMAFKYDFKMLFVDSVAQFQAHGEFKDLKAGLGGIIIGEDEVDGLNPEKIVTYESVVTLGKSAWREEAGALKALKSAIVPQTLYAILVEPSGKTTPLNMEKWMAAVDQAEKQLMACHSKSLLTSMTPDRLLWRAYSFAAVRKGILWWIREGSDYKSAGFAEMRPQTILMDAAGVRSLYDLIPELIDTPEKGRRAVQAAMEVVRKRDLAKSEGKKDKFMNRLRYRMSNRRVYGRIKTKLGGELAEIVCDHGLVDSDARLLLEECGFKITQ